MTTTQLSDIVVSPTTRSRLAALMGFSPTESTKSLRAREDESWYIPYNGPIEPPLEEETRGRGLSRATSNVTRKSSYASTHGNTRTSGIGEAPVNPRSSMGTRGRASTFDRGSMYSKDGDDKGRRASVGSFLTFGQRKRPAAIIAVTAEEAFNGPRRSEESHVRGRPSEDSRWNTQAQRRFSEDSAYSTAQQSQPNSQAAREWDKRKVKNARDSMEVSAGAALAGSGLLARNTSHLEPRAPTYGFGEPRRHWTYDPDEDDTTAVTSTAVTTIPSHLEPRAPTYGLRRNNAYDFDVDDVSSEKESDEIFPQEVSSRLSVVTPMVTRAKQQKPAETTITPQQALPTAVAMRHPYAVVFPTIIDDPQTPLHLRPPARPTHGHSHSLSTNSTSSGSSKPHPSTVSPAAIAAALNNTPGTPRGLLRARAGTFSSPNLRSLAADQQRASPRPAVLRRIPTEQRRELTKLNTQYAAETWCDAIMFPRPRFRAHVISPPSSPPDEKEEDHFVPLRRTVSARAPTTRDEPRHDYRDFMAVPKPELSRSTSNNTQRPPSPIPEVDETLRKVVAEGEQRAKEREVWNHLASSSFQNRRSRSLSRSRTRKLSGPSVARPRLGSDAAYNTESLGARLAAEVFRQPTPTISVTLSTATNSNVHSRNTSRGKVALEESNERKLEGALLSETTARLSVRGRYEEEAEADVQYVDIAPPVPSKAQPPNSNRDRTQSQYSYASDSLEVPGMGIAISTPPPHPSPVEPDMDIPDLSSHPYASPGGPRRRAEPVPIPAAYAGPHPTSFEYPRSSREQPREQPLPPESNKKPEKEPGYAVMGPSAYAYTDGDANDKRESTLGVEEVLLSRTFQRGVARSSVFPGIAEDRSETPAAQAEAEAEAQMPPPPSFVPSLEPTPPTTPGGSRVRRKPVPLTSAPSEIPSLSHTVSTSEHTEVTEVDAEPAVPRQSITMSSPTSMGSGQPSSRLLDDLEPYRDLFYQPGRTGSDPHRSPSFEMIRTTMLDETASTWSEDRIKSSEGLSGLRALARHRPSYESTTGPQEPEQDEENKQRLHDPQLEDVQEVEIPRTGSPLPGLNGDTLPLGTPLRADYEQGQNFPEDIESSRASSIMEREDDDAEKTLRVGSIQPAVAETTQTERRQSTALSIGNTEDADSSRPKRDTVATTVSSLGVPTDDQARTSFVTTTSSTSHMSNLIGDFPAPPLGEGNTMPSAAALHAYFASSDWGGDSRVQSGISTGGGITAPSGRHQSFFAPSESNWDESRVQSHMPPAEGLTVPSAAALQSFFAASESTGDESRVQSHMPLAEGLTASSAAALQSFFAPSESNGDESRVQSHMPLGEGLAMPAAVTLQPPSETSGDEAHVQSDIPSSEGVKAPSTVALSPSYNGDESHILSHIPDPIPE